MFKVMIGFTRGVLTMTKPWQVWMVLLVSVNLVVPFFFLGTPEAIVVLVAAGIGMVIMMMIFAKMGYVKLLGVGHIPWFFTVPWLGLRLGETPVSGFFFYWLLAVVVLDSISLVIDTVDVVKYCKGEREPTTVMNSTF